MLAIPDIYWVSILSFFTASLMILTGIARQRQEELRRKRAMATIAANKRN